eukprot:14335751-Alexandrium_andersonii.AAC.1
MSASLVGSEMCIRDRLAVASVQRRELKPGAAVSGLWAGCSQRPRSAAYRLAAASVQRREAKPRAAVSAV